MMSSVFSGLILFLYGYTLISVICFLKSESSFFDNLFDIKNMHLQKHITFGGTFYLSVNVIL